MWRVEPGALCVYYGECYRKSLYTELIYPQLISAKPISYQLLAELPGELPQLIQANAETLPYSDEYFHGISCVFTFHELPPQARQNVINEISRVLKPGGVFVICDSIQATDSPEFKPMMENFPTMFHEPYYKSYIDDDLGERLKAAGLTAPAVHNHFVSKYWIATKK